MIVVLTAGTTDEQRDEIVRELKELGLGVRAMRGGGQPLLHITSGPTRRARQVLRDDCVQALVPTSGPRLRRHGHRIYPYYLIRWSAAGIVIFGLMVLLAGQLPPGTGEEIQLQHPPATLDWPWYLNAPRALVQAFDAQQRWIGWSALLGLVLVTLALPLIDRTKGEGLQRRWPFVGASVVLVVIALYLTWTGASA